MTFVITGGTLGKGNVVNRYHRFFCFNVTFPTSIKFCVLMVEIPDSASVFGLIIAVFFYTIENPLVA